MNKTIEFLLGRLPKIGSSIKEIYPIHERAVIGLEGGLEMLRYVAGIRSWECYVNNEKEVKHILICSDCRSSNSNDFARASTDEVDLDNITHYQRFPVHFLFPNG